MSVLTDDLRNFLSEKRFPVVATINADSTPQQSVVWYELRGDSIMINTKVGRLKERNLRRDPRVSVCFEDEYRVLAIKGRASLDYDKETSQADIKALAIRYHGQEKGEQMSRDAYSNQERVTINIAIEKITPYGF